MTRNAIDSSLAAALVAAMFASSARAQSILSPCRVAGIDVAVQCGTYSVRENRAEAHGRRIPLQVTVLPSRAAVPAADPVFFVSPGGPGTTNSEALPLRAWYSWMRDERQIVIVDLRGTSGPSRLDCDMSNAALGATQVESRKRAPAIALP